MNNQEQEFQQSPYRQSPYQQPGYEQSEYQQTPNLQPQYQQPEYQQISNQQTQVQNSERSARINNPNFSNHIIYSVIQIIFVPLLYGLIPLILTISANSAWKDGRNEDYEKRTRIAKIFLTIGWIYLAVDVVVLIGFFIYLFVELLNSGF